MITRFHQMSGKDSVYCLAGIATDYQLNGKLKNNTKKEKNKDEVPIKNFRQECREFAKVGLTYI